MIKQRFRMGIWGWWQGHNLGDNWIRKIISEAFPMAELVDTSVTDFSKYDFMLCGGGGLFIFDVIPPWNEEITIPYGAIGLGAEFPLESKRAAELEKDAVIFKVRDWYSVDCMGLSSSSKSYDCTFIEPLPWMEKENLDFKKVFYVWRDGKELVDKQLFKDYIKPIPNAKEKWDAVVYKNFENVLEDDFQTNGDDILERIQNCGFVISGRYHGIVAAIQRGIPFVAIDICPKIRALLQDVGLEEYCIKISQIDQIQTTIDKALKNTDEIRELEFEYRSQAYSKMQENVKFLNDKIDKMKNNKKEKTKKKKAKYLLPFLLLILVVIGLGMFLNRYKISKIAKVIDERGGYQISAAILYNASYADEKCDMIVDYLEQPIAVNLQVDKVAASDTLRLEEYDWVYLDESLLNDDSYEIAAQIEEYTRDGGNVFVPNSFWNYFSSDYIGAKEFVKIEQFPNELKTPFVEADLLEVQTLIKDFYKLYNEFIDIDELKQRDYGYGVIPDKAKTLVKADGTSIYTINKYGKGTVFFTSPLLPNVYSKATYGMQDIGDEQTSYSNTTASCNQLILSDFSNYVAKKIYGFSISRVFGSYGSPSFAWELHYEDVEGIENGSLQIFSELCEESLQIPSYTLVRNSYVWFEQAESMTYLLNQGNGDELCYEMDLYENAYSSGTHAVSGDKWLQLNTLSDCIGYFSDDPSENYRLFPCLVDYNQDGLLDAFCGSEDGLIYYYEGTGMSGKDGRLSFKEPVIVSEVSVSGYSAPQVLDINSDGYLDLIVGAQDGNVYYFESDGYLVFRTADLLIETNINGQILPTCGDMNADGVTDLVLGSDQGLVVAYYGTYQNGNISYLQDNMRNIEIILPDVEQSFWKSPFLVDYNDDDVMDLLIGTYDGYIALYNGDGEGNFDFVEYLSASELNYKGNRNLKFGHYATPVLIDLNDDGLLDLICGYEEYGMAYPIDCVYFPYRAELQEQMNYAKEHNYYVGMHFLTGNYFSPEREAVELKYHMNALQSYGIDGIIGANQHTWNLSEMTQDSQSFMSMYNAGVLWESGYAPPNTTIASPFYEKENAIAYPFYLIQDGEQKQLVQNCSILYWTDPVWTDISGKYKMPMLLYYHCDRIYRGGDDLSNAELAIQVADAFIKKFGYNVVKEDQMMYASAAAYNLDVEVTTDKDKIRITPMEKNSTGALYNAIAQSACGVEIQFSNNWVGFVGTDANVWKKKANSLFVGLDDTIQLYDQILSKGDHIIQVNVPAIIERNENGATLNFKEDGMMQVIVSGDAKTDDPSWTITEVGENTMFTKFGDADILEFYFD